MRPHPAADEGAQPGDSGIRCCDETQSPSSYCAAGEGGVKVSSGGRPPRSSRTAAVGMERFYRRSPPVCLVCVDEATAVAPYAAVTMWQVNAVRGRGSDGERVSGRNVTALRLMTAPVRRGIVCAAQTDSFLRQSSQIGPFLAPLNRAMEHNRETHIGDTYIRLTSSSKNPRC